MENQVISNNRNGHKVEPKPPETIRKGTIIFLADGSVFACDPESQSILGISFEKITDWLDLTSNWYAIHEDGSPFLADEHPARLTLQDGQSRENVIMGIEQPNGDRVWISIDTRPLFQSKNESPYAVTVLLSELGGHQKSFNALQDSNVVFNTVDESTTVLIFAKDRQGRLVKVNSAILRLLGFNEADLIGKTEFEYMSDRDQAEAIRVNDRYVMDTGQILVCEEFANSEDGERRTYLSIKMPYRDEKGNIIGLVGVAPDITERRQLEQQLQETNERLTTILDGMTEAFITLDQDWRITYANQETARLNNMPAEEIIGKTHWEMWPWSVGSIVERNYRQALQTREPIHFEFLYEPLDMWLEVHAYPAKTGLGIFFRDITESKQFEQALQQSEEKFRCMAETIPDVFWMSDIVHSQIIYISPSYEKVWGRSADQLQKNISSWLETIHPDDRAIVKAAPNDCLRDGYNIVEYRIIRPDGSIRWIRDRGYAIKETNGQIQRIAGIAEDITERKQEEQITRERESLLKLALTSAEAGAWSWEITTGKVFWSEEYYALYGLDPAIVTPSYENWINQVDPRDRAMTEQLTQESLKTGEINIRFRALHPTKGQRWLQAKGQILYDDQRQPLRMVGIAQDITERELAEEKLRETADSLALSLSAAKMGYWSWDAHTDLVIFSERGSEIFGLRPNENITWTGILQHLHPEDAKRAQEAVFKAIRDRCDYDTEYRMTRLNDGEECWISAKGRARYDETGNTTGMIGVVHDITDRKRAEAQLQQQARDLEQLNTTLKDATNLLTQRNRELDSFVYAVSHDLKAPLRAIVNLSEWLEEDLGDRLTGDNQHQMNLLRGRVYKMIYLIDGLLEYSRIGRWEANPELVGIKDLLMEIIDSLAPPSTFTISIVEEMPTLLTKRLPLTQVFANLISNAIKHHDRPDGQITITARNFGQYYEFSVQDDGPGIAAQHHERIFGIFQTLKASDNSSSTGLGLTIVKKILETEGGTISVESEVGKGSTFRFTWLVNRDDRI